jgi:hypothetical protein
MVRRNAAVTIVSRRHLLLPICSAIGWTAPHASRHFSARSRDKAAQQLDASLIIQIGSLLLALAVWSVVPARLVADLADKIG